MAMRSLNRVTVSSSITTAMPSLNRVMVSHSSTTMAMRSRSRVTPSLLLSPSRRRVCLCRRSTSSFLLNTKPGI